MKAPFRLAFVASLLLGTAAIAQDSAATADPYLWLEQRTSPRALQWVEAENAKTLPRLEGDPRYKGYYDAALKIAAAEDRIPYPDQTGGRILNFWRDQAHPHGLWRWTTPADYATASPRWTTLLDMDALGQQMAAEPVAQPAADAVEADDGHVVHDGARCHAGERGGCGLAAAGENLAHDGVAVDGEREGAADALVGEGGLADVEAEEIGLEVGVDAEVRGFLALEGEDLGEGEVPGGMELAGAEGALLGLDAVGGIEMYGVEADVGAIPVGGRFFDDNALVGRPLL